MTLQEFLCNVGCKDSDIIEYSVEESIRKSVNYLLFVKDQTEEICIEAVKEYGHSLRYVKEKTEDICLEAVKRDKLAVKFIDKNILVTTK